jgi:apolipoprotein N-acyltransferase
MRESSSIADSTSMPSFFKGRRSPWIALVVSSILAVLSHPTVLFGIRFPDLHALAWLAYAPLFLAVFREPCRVQVRRLFLFGMIFNLGAMYWLYTAMNTFGNLSPFISVLVLVILSMVLTIYFILPFFAARFVERFLRVSPFWSLPIFWVSCEWCRGHWPMGGFPWAQAGYSQASWISLIQISDFTGVYGVTALLIWGNLALVEGVRLAKKDPQARKFRIGFFLLLLVGDLVYGGLEKRSLERRIVDAPKLKIALLQGNIAQENKWLQGKAAEIHQTFKKMSEDAIQQGADLVLWPEASFPYDVDLDDPRQVKIVGEFSKDVIAGAVTYEGQGNAPSQSLSIQGSYPIHNSVFLIHPGGVLGEAYHKQHLVPYGEYIPLKSVLPFLGKLTAQVGEFNAGDRYVLLKSQEAQMGPLICYEDIFPDISRNHAHHGANLLINMTNDAWYGDSSALPQHLSFSPFRAVENHRSLIRATNNGITAVLDPLGRVLKTLPPFERGTLIADVSLVSFPTFYAKWGDVFGYVCLLVSGILVLMGGIRKIKR